MVQRGANYARKPDEFYRTPAEVTQVLLGQCKFSSHVCDPCCGDGAILNVLDAHGYRTHGNDLNRGFNFLLSTCEQWRGHDIVTNPPFGAGGRLALRFIQHALRVTESWGGKTAMLLPVDYDSGKTRRAVFADCPQFAHKLVLLNRIRWFNGVSGSTNHAWFLWDHQHAGPPTLGYGLQVYPEDGLFN